MRRLIFLNRYFFPDHSATSQILSDLAFHCANAGREVHVVTSRQIYDDAQCSLPACDVVNGVHVHRVATTRFGRRSMLGRSLDYLTFYLSAWRFLLRLARPHDLIVAKTDPPLIAVPAAAAARRKNAGLVNWLQDIYPEVAVATGVPFFRGPIAAGFARIRNRSLHYAEANVAVGQLMGRKLEMLGVQPSRIHVIANWCDDAEVRPLAPGQNPLRRAWGLEGKFVVGYSGNLGRAHAFDTVLAAAERLRGDQRFLFLMIGGGTRFDELKNAVRKRELTGLFRFEPYQDRATLAQSLGACDAHWVSLRPQLEGLIVPSKFYGIAAAGRPIVVIGDPNGELAQLAVAYGCGLVVEPGNAAALVDVLRQLASEPDTVAQMGVRARQMLDERFSRVRAFERWQRLLAQLDRLDAEAGKANSRN